MGILCVLLAAAAIATGVAALVRAGRRPIIGVHLTLNALAVPPIVVLAAMRWAGGSPVRQLNDLAPGFDWWGLWADVWVLSVLGLLGCLAVALGMQMVDAFVLAWRLVRRRRGEAVAPLGDSWGWPVALVLAHELLTLAQLFAALSWVASNFPDA